MKWQDSTVKEITNKDKQGHNYFPPNPLSNQEEGDRE